MKNTKTCKTCRFFNSCIDKLDKEMKTNCEDWTDGATKKGGFSDKVWLQDFLQDYIKDCKGLVFGYIGHSNRSNDVDQLIENTLKKHHIQSKGIATRLTSAMGRHLADNPITEERIIKLLV